MNSIKILPTNIFMQEDKDYLYTLPTDVREYRFLYILI